MDILRPELARARRRRQIMYGVAAVVVVVVITIVVSRLEPAAPTVERSTIWVDTVKRGEMIRQVRGAGTLVPEDVRWIPALNEGRVERIILRPGAQLQPDSVILELSNPELEREVLDAEWQVKAAEADFANLRVQLDSQLLNQQAAAANLQADYQEAKARADSDQELLRLGLTSDLTSRISKTRADSLATRVELEKKRLAIAAEATRAQLAAQQARLEQLRALYELRRRQFEALRVRAGMAGVLQEVPVQVGHQLAPGVNLARVADPSHLKAEVRIPATQARDIVLNQKAEIDTRNGVIPGHVIRIDPSVRDGTVTVDVALDAELPRGARPDLNVDGTIELERLASVLYVGRPAFGQESSRVGLFKLVDGGGSAVRVQVQLGRSSVQNIEIVEGLQEGDQVILSDMSAWDAHNRVRLN